LTNITQQLAIYWLRASSAFLAGGAFIMSRVRSAAGNPAAELYHVRSRETKIPLVAAGHVKGAVDDVRRPINQFAHQPKRIATAQTISQGKKQIEMR